MTTARSHDDLFTKLPDWLVESDLPLHDYVVLLVLMKHGRTSGRATPGFATISRQARISRDAVMRALRSLEERGLVEIERRRVGTKNLSNEYTLHVDRARVVAHSNHSTGGGTQRVVADSNQVVAGSDQGWSLGATLTKPINESSERDTTTSGAASTDTITAIENRDAPSVVVLDIDGIFDRVWAEWPKKTSRKNARAKFEIAARRHPRGLHGLADDVLAHGQAHRAHTPVEFVPMLSTWLNGDRWDDPIATPRSGGSSQADRTRKVLGRYLGPDGDAS